MRRENFHLSDEELLRAADGELRARRAAQVRAHLATCWGCRARMAEIEETIADFARAYRQTLGPKLPHMDGPRALLRAQLADMAAKSKVGSWRRFFQFPSSTRAAAYICLGLFVLVFGTKVFVQRSTPRGQYSAAIPFERGTVPDRRLTPGATRRVSIGDICSMPHEEVVRAVPTSLRQEIFQEYGIVNPHTDDYEIDYLIAPGLGGAEDIHNLWPEPYSSPTWNAHVKDALAEHLHQMVCAGEVDLSTAQRDIAADWIAAYKKYFHTDRPLSLSSDRVRF